MAKPQERAEARKLRKEGRSLKEIAKKVEVSVGSVHRWCLDIELTVRQEARLRKRGQEAQMRNLQRVNKEKKAAARERRTKNRKKGRGLVGRLTRRDLLMLGLGMYWGDGGQRDLYTTKCANMDPYFHLGFLQWIELLGVQRENVRAKLTLDEAKDETKEKRWWCRRLGLRMSQFGKTMTRPSPTSLGATKRTDYHGILVLSFHSTDFIHRIFGMLDAAREQIKTP